MSSSILFPTNEYATSSKSTEEIQRLMMNEQSLLDTLSYILNKGHPLQQPYVIRKIKQAFRNFHHYPNQLLPIICGKLAKQDVENQAIIAESLKIIMKKQKQNDAVTLFKDKRSLYSKSPSKNSPSHDQRLSKKAQETPLAIHSEQLDLIFNTSLETLNNWSALNNQHLIDVVEMAIEVKPKVQISPNQDTTTYDKTRQTYLKILEQTILNLGKQSQPIISKIVSGRLIPIFIKYTGHVIRGQMIDIIKRIIGDSQFQAKRIWLQEILPKMLQNLKLEYIELHLQEKIYETIYDENEEIGCMALNVVLKNVSKFSVEEQGSRIVKLFIDSMTSKNEKVAIIVTSLMGEIYEKLQGIILKSEAHCLKFWKSLIEVAESKNEKILNNFIYNLPGILLLSKKYHRVDAVCEVYTELFYNPDADTLLLVAFFHQMAKMFPNKRKLLRQTIYTLFNEIFQEKQVSDQSFKIMDCLFTNLYESKSVFFQQTEQISSKSEFPELEKHETDQEEIILTYFDSTFNEYVQKYYALCTNKKNGNYLLNFYESITKCYEYFSSSFIQVCLLPKIYQSIRAKTPYLEFCMKLLVRFLTREMLLINNYASKINVELAKSARSYEREAAMIFLYYSYLQFSMETFQEFKMGQKFLQFNNEKTLKNRMIFLQYCPEVMYYFTREQKIEFNIILNKLKKQFCTEKAQKEYTSSYQITLLLNNLDFSEHEAKKAEILKKSKKLREKEKSKNSLINSNPNQINFLNSKKMFGSRKAPTDMTLKDLKKEDILKRRVDTKSKTKIMIKEVSKKRTPGTGIRASLPKKH